MSNRPCFDCGQPVDDASPSANGTQCSPCWNKWIASLRATAPTPDEIDIAKELRCLPRTVNRKAIRQVIDWKPPRGRDVKCGLYITGGTGRGKTFSTRLLCRLMEAEGYGPMFLTSLDLHRQLSRCARDLEEPKHLWFASVLLLDDLGKEKLTESFSAHVWELIDKRHSQWKPTIITSRYSGEALIRRFEAIEGSSYGEDIVRRLGEMCAPVDFGAEDPPESIPREPPRLPYAE